MAFVKTATLYNKVHGRIIVDDSRKAPYLASGYVEQPLAPVPAIEPPPTADAPAPTLEGKRKKRKA